MLRTMLLIAAVTVAPQSWAAEPVTFQTLFRAGTTPTPAAQALAGREVELTGFMVVAPNIDKPFFVLVNSPMDTCPFCAPDATWPDQLAAVYLSAPLRPVGPYQKLRVRGTLELGAQTDPNTNLISQLRLLGAEVTPLNAGLMPGGLTGRALPPQPQADAAQDAALPQRSIVSRR